MFFYLKGILMSVGAVVACITFAGIGPLCKRFEERSVLLWGGFLLMAIGRILYIPWGNQLPQMAIVLTNSSSIDLNSNGSNVDVLNELHQNSATNEVVGCPLSQAWCLTTPALTMTQFLLGYFLTCIGYPIGVTLIQTIFSKILGPRPQGVLLLFFFGCCSGSNTYGFEFTK